MAKHLTNNALVQINFVFTSETSSGQNLGYFAYFKWEEMLCSTLFAPVLPF